MDPARRHLARALAYEDAGDSAAAIVEYRNVLQLEPANGAARLRLGRLQLRAGHSESARKNFEAALEAGVAPVRVMLDLGRAYLDSGEFQRVLEVVRPDRLEGRAARARAWSLRGYAEAGLDHAEQARRAFQQALDLVPGDPAALAGLGQLALRSGKDEEVRKVLGESWGQQGGGPWVWRLRGKLEYAAGQYVKAVHSFTQALEANPEDAEALMGIAYARLAQHRPDLALPWVQRLLARSPQHREANLTLARIAIAQGRLEAAPGPLRQVLAQEPDDPRALLSLAAVSYELGQDEQAVSLLRSFLAANPDHLPAQKLLALLYMRLGQAEQARWGLEPLLSKYPKDIQLRVLVVQAAVLAGRFAAARVYASQVLELPMPDSLRERLRRVDAYLSSADEAQQAQVLPLLQEVVDGYRRTALLDQLDAARGALQGGDLERAEARARTLLASPEYRLVGLYLLGMAALAEGDREGFREQMQRILQSAPQNPVAWKALGRLDIADGHWQAAAADFTKALETDDKDYEAMLGMARAEAGAGHRGRAVEWLEKLSAAYPDAVPPRFLLAWTHLRQGRLDEAGKVVEALRGLVPEDPLLLDLSGALYAARGAYGDALRELRKAAAALPRSPRILHRLAWVQAKTGKRAAARRSYAKLLKLDPANRAAAAQWVALELGAKRYAAALGVARRLQDHDPVGAELLQGDIYRAQGDDGAARRAYRRAAEQARGLDEGRKAVLVDALLARLRALSTSPAQRREDLEALRAVAPDQVLVLDGLAQLALERGDVATALKVYGDARRRFPRQGMWVLRLAQTLAAGGDAVQALDTLQDWLALHPDDAAAHLLAASIGLQGGDEDLALEHYRRAATLQPDNAVTLNNAAWLGMDDDPRQSLAYARKAAALQPDATILHTLGVALRRNGKLAEAVEVLRRASAKAPEDLEIRYDLARALQDQGQRKEARKLLKELLASPGPFAKRAEAQELWQRLEASAAP